MAHALRHLSGVSSGVPRTLSRRRVLGLLAGACWWGRPAVVSGQTGAAPVQALRFTVFAATPPAGLTFVPRPGAEPQKVAFQPTARSRRYDYRGPMPLRFSDATGKTVAEATVPAGLREVVLLFLGAPAGDAGLAYRIAVLDDSAQRLGAGGLAIINLSGLALSGTVNTAKVTLAPGLNPALAVGRAAKIELHTTFKGRVYQAYAATVALKAGERALVILFPPFNPSSLAVMPRVLLDQPSAASKGAK